MIIITGPQGTAEECGRLDEMAGLLNALRVSSDDITWSGVTDMYCLDGWERCPLAVADIKIAELFGLTVTHITL